MNINAEVKRLRDGLDAALSRLAVVENRVYLIHRLGFKAPDPEAGSKFAPETDEDQVVMDLNHEQETSQW